MIAENVVGFFELLIKWRKERKGKMNKYLIRKRISMERLVEVESTDSDSAVEKCNQGKLIFEKVLTESVHDVWKQTVMPIDVK